MHIELALFSIGRRWSFRNYSIQSLFGFFFFTDFGIEVHGVFVCREAFAPISANVYNWIMFPRRCNYYASLLEILFKVRQPSNYALRDMQRETYELFCRFYTSFYRYGWNSVVLKRIFWDVRGQMLTSCGYKFGFKILKLVYFSDYN